jgi:hypothetical protein
MLRRFFRPRQPPAEPSPETEPPPLKPAPVSRLLAFWQAIQEVCARIDAAFIWLAVPFGVNIQDPLRRYAVMLGLFVVIYILGSLHLGWLSLAALAFGYLGVLAIGRAWVVNEKVRTSISRKLRDGDPDQMPDLRWTALVSALQLLILFPLLFQQLERNFQLYRVTEDATFLDWLWFSIDKTYLKALPDWSILYGVHISSIDFASPWGRHLVLLSRLTFDYILIQGGFRLLAIRATISEAVAAVKADPEMAVRLGKRAIEPLVEKLHDPDRAVRGAAANALTQLGEGHRIAEETAASKEPG